MLRLFDDEKGGGKGMGGEMCGGLEYFEWKEGEDEGGEMMGWDEHLSW